MPATDIAVLGAGMVGVCSALALQRQGYQVTLIDRKLPGEESSFGNAGMITPSSLLPINNPNLLRQLPNLLANKSAGFNYKLPYTVRQITPLSRFLSLSREPYCTPRIEALHQLIALSRQHHQTLSSSANCTELLRPSGWLKLYRSTAALHSAGAELSLYERYNIATRQLNQLQLQAEYPALHPIFTSGLLIEEALSVARPDHLVKAYAKLFTQRGGSFVKRNIQRITQSTEHWQLCDEHAELHSYSQLVLATGPWSKQVLAPLGIKLPMIYERGAHREYTWDSACTLNTPIHDVEGSYVLTPTPNGVRITCGVTLSDLDSPYSLRQLEGAQTRAREALHFSRDYS
ncbi:MAG: NAD(P)/FAD-dependent oxidoreductase, partial [Pseudomonadales bacterium]